jgi:hypothetical protein
LVSAKNLILSLSKGGGFSPLSFTMIETETLPASLQG